MKYILSIDRGTTGTTTFAYGVDGRPLARAYREIPQYYPRPGWVEHDAEDIWRSVMATAEDVVGQMGCPPIAVGITNQRETTVLWDRDTGKPLCHAIVWQCRRTKDICDKLRPHESLFREKTGLPLDPYFSGTKIRWLLDNSKAGETDNVVFGTIDSWLVWKLTGGKVHATDLTNAIFTMIGSRAKTKTVQSKIKRKLRS